MAPISINEKGYAMISRLGLDKMFSRNWRRIDDLITSDCEEKTAYDINNFCIEQAVVFPEKFLEDEDIDKLKEDSRSMELTYRDDYLKASMTFRLASSTFFWSKSMYIDVTADPISCPNAADMVSLGMSMEAAIVAQVWRDQ